MTDLTWGDGRVILIREDFPMMPVQGQPDPLRTLLLVDRGLAVGPQGPSGESFFHVGPTPPDDLTIPWIVTPT